MAYIPQEAKEQITNLTESLNKAEKENKSLKAQLKEVGSSKENSKTILVVIAAIALAFILLFVYTYSFGPLFGDLKHKVENYEYMDAKVEKLSKENSDQKETIDKLTIQLEEGGVGQNPELVYSIQIGAFKKFKMSKYKSDIQGVEEHKEDGFNKYSLGFFDSYQDALLFKKEISRIGIKDAFLVAEYKGEKVDIKKAIKLEKK